MTSPYRLAPVPFLPALPALDTTRCPGCGEEGLSVDDHTHSTAQLVIVRPCSWWRRLLGCREDREHVHCRHERCRWPWTAQPAGHR